MDRPHHPYDLGVRYCSNQHHDVLHRVLDDFPFYGHGGEDVYGNPVGLALEFGVGAGHSLRCIAGKMPVLGFDSFEGLPEDWRPGFDKGAFAHDFNDVQATIPGHCALVYGLFEETLPEYFKGTHGPSAGGFTRISLVHIDCDLYSSTKTVLDNLPWRWMVRFNTTIVFDEWHGYPGAERHEQRAWREFAERTGVRWSVIGHGDQAWGIRLCSE